MSRAAMRRCCASRRKGTTCVEFAFVLPVFITLVFGMIQVCHAQMVEYVLKSACRNAARFGSAGSITTAQTRTKVEQIVSSAVDPTKVTIQIKDAQSFESGTNLPSTGAGYSALPDLELADAEPRQMFLVRATVDYNDIAIITMPYCEGLTISAEALIRHE